MLRELAGALQALPSVAASLGSYLDEPVLPGLRDTFGADEARRPRKRDSASVPRTKSSLSSSRTTFSEALQR
jgi:hypothetical protein